MSIIQRYTLPHTLAYKREILDGLFCASISSLMGFLDETCLCGVESELSNVFPTRCRSRTRAPFLAKPLLSNIFLPHHGRTMEQSTVFFFTTYASFRHPYFPFFQIAVHAPFGLTGRQVGTCQFESIGTGRNDNDDRSATLST